MSMLESTGAGLWAANTNNVGNINLAMVEAARAATINSYKIKVAAFNHIAAAFGFDEQLQSVLGLPKPDHNQAARALY